MTHSQKLYQHLVRALMVAPMLSSVALGACDDTDYANTGEQDASNNNDETDDDTDMVTTPDPIACQEALESGVWTYDEGCGDGTWDLSHEAVAAMVGDDTCVYADNTQGEAPCYQSFFLQTWPEWLRDVSNIENNGLYLYYVGSEEGVCTYAFSLDTCVAIGRALRMEEDFTTCEAQRQRSQWCMPALREPLGQDLPAEQRRLLGLMWTQTALSEHASVASFAKAALDWMQAQAPPAILHGLQRAGMEEVEHARVSFAIASSLLDHEVAPGPLPPMNIEPKTLAEMAAETLEDGALSETLAVARTMHMLDRAQPQPIRAILTTIVDEESRHAALGWNMVRWAIEQGGDEVRWAVTDAAQRLRSQCASVTLPAPEPVRDLFGVYGQLDDAQMAEIHKEAWEHCVEPMLRAVLA